MRTITVQIPDDVTETEAQASIARLFNPDWLASWWSIEDVQGERPHLTDDQAREVLAVIDRRHDASIGINWDFIQDIADSLFDEPEELEQD